MIGFITVLFFSSSLNAAPVVSDNHSVEDLDYGVVLFDYFQHNYFSALVEQSYAEALKNPLAISEQGQSLKGGMMLSYGMADEAKKMFEQLLEGKSSAEAKNKAWFYLAKMFYNKSDAVSARASLNHISGKMPNELQTEYQYLASLLDIDSNHFIDVKKLSATSTNTPYFPYLLFNMAVLQLKSGQLENAVKNLEEVVTYSGKNEEMNVLADRARHGLAELAIKHNQLPEAWSYLKNIRTTGLYSNRALLSYAWAAINLKQFNDSIPALEMLNSRSIAIPEVQEAKVLLAHIYEQEGSLRKALKMNLLAEKEFNAGINMVAEARHVIDMSDIPREFIKNLEALMDETDWYGAQPSVSYKKLTPFLVDLMASNAFHEALRELADLYAIEENLNYWMMQADQHELILANAKNKNYDNSMRDLLQKSTQLKEELVDQSNEIKLSALALNEEEQTRLNALMQTTNGEMKLLNDKIIKLKKYDKPYAQPESYEKMVADKHAEIKAQLAETEKYIRQFEIIMRKLVNVELDNHEERMRYYLAQSRLAKARLYDITLLSLEQAKTEQAKKTVNGERNSVGDKNEKH